MIGLIQKFLADGSQINRTPAMVPVQLPSNPYQQQDTLGRNNPFMTALQQDSAQYKSQYGVNRPLAKPMFLGHRDNQALYGGSKLFILY